MSAFTMFKIYLFGTVIHGHFEIFSRRNEIQIGNFNAIKSVLNLALKVISCRFQKIWDGGIGYGKRVTSRKFSNVSEQSL